MTAPPDPAWSSIMVRPPDPMIQLLVSNRTFAAPRDSSTVISMLSQSSVLHSIDFPAFHKSKMDYESDALRRQRPQQLDLSFQKFYHEARCMATHEACLQGIIMHRTCMRQGTGWSSVTDEPNQPPPAPFRLPRATTLPPKSTETSLSTPE